MDNLEKKILEAFQRDKEYKGIIRKDNAEFLFEGLEDITSTPLDEFIEANGDDYTWEETLEEALAQQEDKKLKVYKVGDIIVTNNYQSKSGKQIGNPHKILVITRRLMSSGGVSYEGFLLSSQIHKANKNNVKFPHNIYIQDYSTILHRSSGNAPKKEAFIRVDDIVRFTDKDLSSSGSWKGSASYQFIDFVKDCHRNYRSGKDNSQSYWIR